VVVFCWFYDVAVVVVVVKENNKGCWLLIIIYHFSLDSRQIREKSFGFKILYIGRERERERCREEEEV